MGDRLVSIIIPVYNVEFYIEKCIMSCINQSYKNIEIIIIDDGSTDNSGSLVNKISMKDNRIKVIHKKNQGVSQARNDGIMISRGDYIVFLDADDYLMNDYIDYMLFLVDETSADFCLSKNCFTSREQTQVVDNITILNNEDATTLILSPLIEVGCWNKIFKRNFLIDNNIFFLKDLFYGEGLYFITKASQLANKIGVGEKRVYYYRKNNLSSATTYFNYDKYINGEKSLLKIKSDFLLSSKKVLNMWEFHYCLFCINSLFAIINNNNIIDYKKKYNYWISLLRKLSKKIFLFQFVSLKEKVYVLLSCFFPKVLAKRNKRQIEKRIKLSI